MFASSNEHLGSYHFPLKRHTYPLHKALQKWMYQQMLKQQMSLAGYSILAFCEHQEHCGQCSAPVSPSNIEQAQCPYMGGRGGGYFDMQTVSTMDIRSKLRNLQLAMCLYWHHWCSVGINYLSSLVNNLVIHKCEKQKMWRCKVIFLKLFCDILLKGHVRKEGQLGLLKVSVA